MEILTYSFMQHAIAAGLLSAIACGVIGALVVVNRMVFISGGLAHAAYGGIGIAVYFGIPFVLGTLGFSLFTAVVMAWITLRDKNRTDTIIGILWAGGMALGIILTDLKPGYNTDLMSYLFGSVLAVSRSDLLWMSLMTGLVLIVLGVFYKGFLALFFDEEFARVRGLPVAFLHFLFISMIAVTIVLIIRVIGLILVISMFTIPPLIMENHVRSLVMLIVFSVVLNTIFTLGGLWISCQYNLSSGASIIAVSILGFVLAKTAQRLKCTFKNVSSQ